jgi:hypothetical protein
LSTFDQFVRQHAAGPFGLLNNNNDILFESLFVTNQINKALFKSVGKKKQASLCEIAYEGKDRRKTLNRK